MAASLPWIGWLMKLLGVRTEECDIIKGDSLSSRRRVCKETHVLDFGKTGREGQTLDLK